MSKLGVYTGTFDPITLGHINVIERSRALVDELVIGIGMNFRKTPMFSLEERVDLIQQSTSHLDFVKVEPYDGLAVDFVNSLGAKIIIRGIRPWVGEFEGEMKMATANRQLSRDVETVFLVSDQSLWQLSSSLVREVAPHTDADTLRQFVPEPVVKAILDGRGA